MWVAGKIVEVEGTSFLGLVLLEVSLIDCVFDLDLSLLLDLVVVDEQFSGVLRYYLKSDRFEPIYPELFAQNEIFSFTESLVDALPSGGYFVEEQNSSVLWIFKDEEVKYKNILPSQHEGHHHLANWGRVMP